MSIDSASAYDHHAKAFLRARDQSNIGADVVAQWCHTLGKDAQVLELACGGGYPITRVLHEAGMRLWAIESSPSLVAEFQRRFPDVPVQCAKVQDSDFFGRNFDAVVAVGLMFLLSETDQAALIHRVAQVLSPGGRFLFTAPLQSCQWVDLITGIPSHALGRTAYEKNFHSAGLSLIATYTDSGANHYYEAQRIA
ncbi:class I SAM-dependent methyltransferase [Undibacterium sp. Di24W]|uniref:class I SAM-dependent methyltransferase n=1 Tax=Undibacterium sp. Di24W TaxID=3413033 RepID=UPI003BF424E0